MRSVLSWSRDRHGEGDQNTFCKGSKKWSNPRGSPGAQSQSKGSGSRGKGGQPKRERKRQGQAEADAQRQRQRQAGGAEGQRHSAEAQTKRPRKRSATQEQRERQRKVTWNRAKAEAHKERGWNSRVQLYLGRLVAGMTTRDLAWSVRFTECLRNVYLVDSNPPSQGYHPERGELPWPVILALGSHSRKHIFEA